MKLKVIFQVFLALFIVTILTIFFYKYLIEKDKKNVMSKKNNEENISELKIQSSSQLENIEYNSYDSSGNSFYINAKKAIANFSSSNESENTVKLSGVISIINLKNKGIINIYSKEAIYNKSNHDTSFYNDVMIEYIDNQIYSQNFDIFFSENKSEVYNNVILKNKKLNLNTDKIFIDMISGDIKFEMFDKSKKVRLISKYEFIN